MPDTDSVRVAYRSLALGDLESWLRMNRAHAPDGTAAAWPWRGYEAEVEALTGRYLRGTGWVPGEEFTAVHVDVVDGVQEAAVGAWRLATGVEPWTGGRDLRVRMLARRMEGAPDWGVDVGAVAR